MSLNLFDLGGRTALVTGSSSGIGLAIAQGLAAAGARVAIHGRDAEPLKTALADVPGAVAVRFDVTDEAAVAAGIAEAALGRIDILVNNAGLQQRGPVTEFALADWNRMLATHLTGAFLVARSVAPGMVANGGGKIINICRWGRVEELVGPALFLASDASSFVTGQILYVDGGILASI